MHDQVTRGPSWEGTAQDFWVFGVDDPSCFKEFLSRGQGHL